MPKGDKRMGKSGERRENGKILCWKAKIKKGNERGKKSEGNGRGRINAGRNVWSNIVVIAQGVLLAAGVWACRYKLTRDYGYHQRTHKTREVNSGRLDKYSL